MGTHWLVMDGAKEAARAPYRARLAVAGVCHPAHHRGLMSATRHHTHIDLERQTGIHQRRLQRSRKGLVNLFGVLWE